MNYCLQLLVEALAVGALTLAFGLLIFGLVTYSNVFAENKKCESNYAKLSVVFFLTGFFIHLFCEGVQLNKWYISNGAATKLGNTS